MKKKLIQLFAIMVILSAIGAVIITIAGQKKDTKVMNADDKIHIVTTIYPVYLIGMNITDQINDIELTSLIQNNTGCLHDYQLTTKDMKKLALADVLIINGGGMEGFMDDVTANYPDLTVIDAGSGIKMLPNEDGGKIRIKTAEEDEGEYNPHVWLNPKLYIKQIENVRDSLIQYIESSKGSSNSDTKLMIGKIRKNSKTYIAKIKKIDREYDAFGKRLEGKSGQTKAAMQAVIFHDSFAYLAERIGMKVAFTVPLESDTALSAGEIAEIVDEVKKEDIRYLFTERQYSNSIAKQIAEETNARVYIIDSVVTGNGAKDSYLKAMNKNLRVLMAASK